MQMKIALQRDFAPEWRNNLKVQHQEPLGEVRINRLLRDNKKD
ncbi:MAG: hypothetical protein V3R30_13300 [Kiloniellales bacterium]